MLITHRKWFHRNQKLLIHTTQGCDQTTRRFSGLQFLWAPQGGDLTSTQTGSLYGRQEVMPGTHRKFRVRGESGGSREKTLLEVAAEEVIRSYFLFTTSNPVMSVLFLHSHCDVFYLQQMMIHTYIVWKARLIPSGSEHSLHFGDVSPFPPITFSPHQSILTVIWRLLEMGGGGYVWRIGMCMSLFYKIQRGRKREKYHL